MSLPKSFVEMITGFGLILEGEASYEYDGIMIRVQTYCLVNGTEKFVATASVWPDGFQRLSVKRFKSEQFKEALWVETEADIKTAAKRLEKLILGSNK